MVSKEDLVKKNGHAILEHLRNISKWIDNNRLEIPKNEMILEEIMKIVIAELERLLLESKVIQNSLPFKLLFSNRVR